LKRLEWNFASSQFLRFNRIHHDGPGLRKAIDALTKARDAEAKGLRVLAKLVLTLGAEEIDPEQAGLPHL
jgi:hypothetical protein